MSTTGKLSKERIRWLTTMSVLSAIAFVLMVLEFSIPIMPSFIKLDFSELPALIASFAFGPLSGILVCLIKNLLHLPFSSSMCVGELSNFVLGSTFVGIAGLIYKKNKTKKRALIGSLVGALSMALISLPTNYYIVYPFYATLFHMPIEAIVGAYTLILKSIKSLWQALFIFNLPFTFVKGLIDVAVTFAVYKRIEPVLKGKKN